MTTLFRLLGRLPLAWNHRIGALLGGLAWLLSARHRRITRENIAQFSRHTGNDNAGLVSAAAIEQGKGMAELAVAWTAPLDKLYELVRECHGWEHVDAAKAAGRAVIFVTPHLGCYDIAGRYLESRIPVTALYRPPKLASLEPIMQEGRVRGGGSTASADARGVRSLLKTLKSGGNIIILPDQVPAPEQGGEGVWVPFFGRPAYTMTLLPRLAQSADAVVLFFFAERLPGGRGFRVHIEPPVTFSADRASAAAELNGMVERLVAMAPAQYLWGYNRYKHPAGAPPPPPPSMPRPD